MQETRVPLQERLCQGYEELDHVFVTHVLWEDNLWAIESNLQSCESCTFLAFYLPSWGDLVRMTNKVKSSR